MLHRRRWIAGVFAVALAGITVGVGSGTGRVGAAATARANPPFGFSYPAGYPGFASASTSGADMNSIAPGSVLRLPINWSELQSSCAAFTGPGVCDGGPSTPSWGFMDSTMASLHRDGIRVIADVNDAPDWDWNLGDCGRNCAEDLAYKAHSIDMPPANTARGLAYLSSFVGALVSRYDTLYPGEIAGVEIWNEENSKAFWPTTAGPSPARYSALLCAAYQGVRSADRTAPVILGGLAYVAGPSTSGYVDIPDFLTGGYAAGVATCMTGIGLHSYPGEEPDLPGGPFLAALDQVRSTDAGNGVSRPIWITEFGYCVTGSTGCTAVSERQQGYYIECAYQMVLGMPDVAVFSAYTLYDTAGTTQLAGVYESPTEPRTAVKILTALFATYGSGVPAISHCAQAYGWPSGGP